MTLQEIVAIAKPEQLFWRKSGSVIPALVSKHIDMVVDHRFYPGQHIATTLGVVDILAEDWEFCGQEDSFGFPNSWVSSA